jgi:hypothetical protein
VGKGVDRLQPHARYETTRAAQLASEAGNFDGLVAGHSVPEVLLGVLALSRDKIDLDHLRDYLDVHRDAYQQKSTVTAWAKAVCLYDYHRFGAIT